MQTVEVEAQVALPSLLISLKGPDGKHSGGEFKKYLLSDRQVFPVWNVNEQSFGDGGN